MSPRSGIRAFIVLLMVAPLAILVAKSGFPDLPPAGRLISAIGFSLVQSSLSTAASLLLGFVGALGLCALPPGKRLSLSEAVILVPTWTPPIFVILSTLSAVTIWLPFPFGLKGVILVHAIMNSGLVAVALGRLFRNRLGGQMELAWIEGASRWRALKVGAWPQIRRDVALIAIVVFGMAFTSFAVPLIVGGVRATTLEVFIYQQLHSGKGIGVAVGVGLIQMGILSMLAIWASSGNTSVSNTTKNLKFIGWLPALALPVGLTALLVFGSGWSWITGFETYQAWPRLQSELAKSMVNTILVSLGTGATVVALIAASAFASPHPVFRRWLLGYSMPSTVLVGVALMTIGPSTGPWVLFKIIMGLSLILFPPLYRWMGDGAIASLYAQVSVARTMGAGWGQIWGRILIPQLSKELGLIGALAALWASGDFALSSLVAYQDLTVAMLVDELMSSYRLELATWLMAPMLLAGFGCGALFLGAGYVTSRKFSSGLR